MNHMKLKHILALMLVVIATTTGCSAKNNRAIKHHEIVAADSIMKKAVGDSIYSIITHAKKINASLITRVDSTCKIVTKKSPAKGFRNYQIHSHQPEELPYRRNCVRTIHATVSNDIHQQKAKRNIEI